MSQEARERVQAIREASLREGLAPEVADRLLDLAKQAGCRPWRVHQDNIPTGAIAVDFGGSDIHYCNPPGAAFEAIRILEGRIRKQKGKE